jgi:DNA gyrase inhibitor GyrI
MIALEAGFGSHSEFTRAFRRWFGLVPSAWDRRSRLAPVSVREESSWNGPGIQELIRADTGPPVRASRIRLPRARMAYVRVIRPFEAGALARGWDKLQTWMARNGVPLPRSGLVGMSWDDVEATPLDQIRYDLAIEVASGTPAGAGIGMQDFPAMECLAARAAGSLARVARVWDHLYRVSLPAARRDPGNWPAQERYRVIPDFARDDGWDLDCVVPLR